MSPIALLEELTPCKHYHTVDERIDYLEKILIPSLQQYHHEKCPKAKKLSVMARIDLLFTVLDKLTCL
jgi:hypothetical protein